jgi:phage gp36-like protein
MAVTSYATGLDFLARYDARLFGDLVSDEGYRVPPNELPTNTNLIAALEDAYGEIVSTIVVGGRYTLYQIDPANLSPAAMSYLVRLNCDLALILIKRRRGVVSDKDKAIIESAANRLKALKDGAGYLLSITDTMADASVMKLANPLTVIPIWRRNTIRGRTREYYPNYPVDRGPGCSNTSGPCGPPCQ